MFRSVVLVLNAKFPKLIHFLLGDDGCRLCHRANTRSMRGFGNVDTCSKHVVITHFLGLLAKYNYSASASFCILPAVLRSGL